MMVHPQPFIKWAGGKRQLLSKLLEHVPAEFGTYHEPFLGGGALFFALAPKKAYLSDINKELTTAYLVVRDRVGELVQELATMPHTKEFFLSLRSATPTQMLDWSIVKVAARLVYLNKTGFNGLYRVNRSGQFNVPFGKQDAPNICDEGRLRACSETLRSANIMCADYLERIEYAPGDFVYFDPPYIPLSKTSNFTAYSSNNFLLSDHMNLARHARRLKANGVHVLLSNSDTPTTRELYADGFEFEVVQAKRTINCKANDRGPVGELVIW